VIVGDGERRWGLLGKCDGWLTAAGRLAV